MWKALNMIESNTKSMMVNGRLGQVYPNILDQVKMVLILGLLTGILQKWTMASMNFMFEW